MMPRPPQKLELRPDPAELRLMRAFVARWAHACGLSDRDAFDACLVATEAVTNAIRHGRDSGRDDEPIRVECRMGDDGLLIRVNDRGTFQASRQPDPDAVGGRGLMLIEQLTDSYELHKRQTGTEVAMRLVPRRSHGPMHAHAAA